MAGRPFQLESLGTVIILKQPLQKLVLLPQNNLGAFCIFQYFMMVHTYCIGGWEREELLCIQKVNCGMISESHLLAVIEEEQMVESPISS